MGGWCFPPPPFLPSSCFSLPLPPPSVSDPAWPWVTSCWPGQSPAEPLALAGGQCCPVPAASPQLPWERSSLSLPLPDPRVMKVGV